MSDENESPVQASRLSFSATSVVGLVLTLVTLIGTACAGAWQVRGQLESIEAKLDRVSEKNLRESYYTRVEASRFYHDLEKSLTTAGVRISFPPPEDPMKGAH